MAGQVTPPPKPVDISRWLWIGSALLGMGRFVMELADRERLISELRRRYPEMSQDQIDAGIQTTILLGLAVAAVILLLYAKLANRMARGRNWARVVLTVLGAAMIMFGLLRLVVYLTGLAELAGVVMKPSDVVITAITVMLDAAALTLMYLPSVAAHFRKKEIAHSGGHRT